MDQELTFLKKSIDRRAHDHSSFFLLVTNRVVLTEKKSSESFSATSAVSKDTKDKVNHLSTTTTVAPDVEHGLQRLPLHLTYVINQTCEFFNTLEGTEFNNDIIDF